MVIHAAIAILYREEKFLMQLRDNIPNILYPGHWAFFGGHIEPGESPDVALQREVLEEIGYTIPPTFIEFGLYPDEQAVRHVFAAPLLVELSQLVLNEGWDMGLVTIDDIRRGSCYSQIAGEHRPIGAMHQRILLDFINKQAQ